MKELIVLIGLPCSGKSTWREKNDDGYVVCSSDDEIEKLCAADGLTYNQGFEKHVKTANHAFDLAVRNAFKNGDNIIIDRTNMSVKSRKRYIGMADRAGYYKVAVVFEESPDVIAQRMKDRFEKTGKSVPANVMKSMADNYDAPTQVEGFDEIRKA